MGKKRGICRLLHTEGEFAKSHIIPDAFMRRISPSPFMQWDGESRPRKMFSGWYDTELLGHEGEAIIARYDDYIAKVLYSAGWTYRKRRPHNKPEELKDNFIAGFPYSIEPVNTNQIRLFALSLLWRAAETNNSGFSDVKLRPELREDLRQRIVSGDAGNFMEFPVYFTFFDSKYELTKMSPIRFQGHPFFRFFLDGVACYVAKSRTNLWSKKQQSMMVGAQKERLVAVCIDSENTHHARNDSEMLNSLFDHHGDVFRPFYT